MAKNKYLSAKKIRTKITKLIEAENRQIPTLVLEELELKILTRAETIASKIDESASNKSYVTEEQFNRIISEIQRSHDFAQIDPGSAVGMVAAQSIGEPGTQMSLPGNETVVVKVNDQVDILPIGDFIENMIENLIDVDALAEPYNHLVVDIPEELEIYVPGLGTDEKVRWQRLRQVSRHPPNGDLIKISTRSGRSIIGTFSHSFIIRKDNQITPVKGSDLKLADRMPAVLNLAIENPKFHLNIENYLAKSEIWYGSELKIAVSSGSAWRDEYGQSYTVPVKKEALWKAMKTGKDDMLKPGFVYPKMHHSSHTKIPEKLELDDLFGFFIGAYLAEGSLASHFISITNSDFSYRQKIIDFAEKIGVNCRVKEDHGEYGDSTSVILSSSLLSRLLERMCGKTSFHKFIPPWVLNTNDDFVTSLLQAYFDGDGNVSSSRSMIRASSNSKKLLDGICLLLSRFGIFATKSYSKQFTLQIPGRYSLIFQEKIDFLIERKQKTLSELVEAQKAIIENETTTYDVLDMIPGYSDVFDRLQNKLGLPSRLVTKLTKKQRVGRRTLERYIKEFRQKAVEINVDIEDEISPLERAVAGDVLWDEIVKLESIKSPTEFVYDFTVSELETFLTGDGLVTHNTLRTFHFAGVREMNVTLGLPRLIEIVDARRNPSTPSMVVALDKEYAFDPDKAKEVARNIELTTITNVATSVDIDQINQRVTVVLDPDLLSDKGITSTDVKNKTEHRRSTIKVVQEGNLIHVRPDKDDPTLSELQKLAEKLRGIPIKGLKGVKRVLIRKRTDRTSDKDEYEVISEGSNFMQLLRIPGVDPQRTYTNHIHEIADTLGIEASRNAILHEANDVMEKQGLEVDHRHIELVADLMTFTGTIRQIGRHGISGENSSVLVRAAFEVTVKHLLEAAIRGEADNLVGIIENVMVGQEIALGTGIVDLTINPQYRKFSSEQAS